MTPQPSTRSSHPLAWLAAAIFAATSSLAQTPPEAAGEGPTEAFVTFDFTVPSGIILGPPGLGEAVLLDANAPGGILAKNGSAGKTERWDATKKCYTVQSSFSKLSLPVGQKFRGVLATPAIDTQRGQLVFVEVSTNNLAVDKGMVGMAYFEDTVSKTRILTREDALKSNPPLSIQKKCEEVVYLYLQVPKGTKVGWASKDPVEMTIAGGNGTKDLTNVATFKASFASRITPDPNIYLFTGKAPVLPADAPRDLQVFTKTTGTGSGAKKESTLVARGKLAAPSPAGGVRTMGGTVIKLESKME